jgi:predicted transcriptional regulator
MTTKDKAIEIIRGLPEGAPLDDIQDRIGFVAAVRKGLNELDGGRGVDHEKIKLELNTWNTV